MNENGKTSDEAKEVATATAEVQSVEIFELPEYLAFREKVAELGVGYVIVGYKKPSLKIVSKDYFKNDFCMDGVNPTNSLALTAANQLQENVKEHSGMSIDEATSATRLIKKLEDLGIKEDDIMNIVNTI